MRRELNSAGSQEEASQLIVLRGSELITDFKRMSFWMGQITHSKLKPGLPPITPDPKRPTTPGLSPAEDLAWTEAGCFAVAVDTATDAFDYIVVGAALWWWGKPVFDLRMAYVGIPRGNQQFGGRNLKVQYMEPGAITDPNSNLSRLVGGDKFKGANF